MIAETAMGLGALKTALDLVKGLQAASTKAEINDVKIALQERIWEAREALAAAQDTQASSLARIRDLEQKVVSFEDWEREKQRYQLKAVDSGAFAYMHKPGMEDGEPPHWLCTDCFGRRQKSILQTRGQIHAVGGGRGSHASWVCNACKGTLSVYYTRKPSEPWEPKKPEAS